MFEHIILLNYSNAKLKQQKLKVSFIKNSKSVSSLHIKNSNKLQNFFPFNSFSFTTYYGYPNGKTINKIKTHNINFLAH